MAGIVAKPLETLRDHPFSHEEVRSFGDVLRDKMLEWSNIDNYHIFYPNVRMKKDYVYLGAPGMVGIPKPLSCDRDPQDWQIPSRRVTFDPKRWDIEIHLCAADFEDMMTLYDLKLGNEVRDLDRTKIAAALIDNMKQSVAEMFVRMFWFSEEGAADFDNGGTLTNGTDTRFFNLTNGFFYHMMDISSRPENARQRVVIDANTQPTFAGQIDNLTGDAAFNVLERMHLQASMVLKQQRDLQMLATQSFVDGYLKYLRGKELESTFTNVQNGVRRFWFNGIEIIPVPIWDKIIQSYQNDGTKIHQPHRVVFAPRTNLGVAHPGPNIFDEVDFKYIDAIRKNVFEATDELDVQIMQDDLFVIAC